MRGRDLLAGVLVLLGCLSVLVVVPAVWVSQQLRTDGYLQIAGPLIKDPAVQTAVAHQLSTDVTRQVDVPRLANGHLDDLAKLGVPEALLRQIRKAANPAQAALAALVEKGVRDTMSSPAAGEVWTSGLQNARQAIVQESGEEPKPVTVDLAPLVDDVKHRLVTNGFTVAARVQPPSTEIVILNASAVGEARRWYDTAGMLGLVLPILAVASFGLALVLSPRRRTFVSITFGTAVAMGVVLLGIAAARDPLLARLAADQAAIGAVVYDAFARSLRYVVWWVLGIALGLAFIGLAIPRRKPASTARGYR
ncbi:MAG TPA: hypothetical protein VE287_00440 [Actinopolymorphaceae bacterium]|jgi:hypothetical protein|nr:hypothetical protein [Actinopolymorphaceae bacterium]